MQKGPSCTQHPAPTSSRRPFSGGRNEGGAEGPRAREGSTQEWFSSQLVTSWSRQSHGLHSQISEAELLPVFSRGRGRVGRAGLGGPVPPWRAWVL